jgi:protein tyrosine phosphatase (PTP) superfamily phosphohydrolase (DUF442 family)
MSGSSRFRKVWLAVAAAGLVAAALAAAYLINRYGYGNFGVVVEGEVFRSAQPRMSQLVRWADEYSLKTVVRLRASPENELPDAEREKAAALGLTFHEIEMTARRRPGLIELRELVRVLESAERPMLIHCRSGVDRTGVASVMAAMAVGGQDYQAARDQLFRDSGITRMLSDYEAWCRVKGLDGGGWEQFRDWLLNDYRPGYYWVQIEVPSRRTAASRARIEVEAVVTNRSHTPIPFSSADRVFHVGAFFGSSVDQQPERLGNGSPPAEDLAPGKSVTVGVTVGAPKKEGRYTVRFDLVEEKVTWFASRGSPMAEMSLVVAGE